MKEIVVISGKGGTGKTTIVAAFAALAKNAVFADCDVDAADLHLILQPTIKKTSDFSGGKTASIIAEKCIGCGECRQLCNFDAVLFNGPPNDVVEKTYTIYPIACEGCGVCAHFCPNQAVEFKDALNGQWFISDTRFGPMLHARLTPGQENSGKLVTLIRKQAGKIAVEKNKQLIIVDGSPGIGCPVIASVNAADLVLVLTEPTLSGKHDLERVLELTSHFKIKTAVCINKYDINPNITNQIENKIKQKNLKIAGKIRYDTLATKAQTAAKTIIEYSNGQLKEQITALWKSTLKILNTEN